MVLKYLIAKFSNLIIGCKLLSIQQDMEFFNSLKAELTNIKEFELLFRASEHDYSVLKFHSLCDNKGPTLSIIKSNSGNIFGGYTSISWSTSDSWVNDPNAFIFLIKSDDLSIHNKCPLIFKTKKHDFHKFSAVWHGKSNGPSFGGQDIMIFKRDSNNKLIYRCRKLSYDYGEYNLKSICGGDDNDRDIYFYKVLDYEIFKIEQ